MLYIWPSATHLVRGEAWSSDSPSKKDIQDNLESLFKKHINIKRLQKFNVSVYGPFF